jgi:hypothetical protein
MIYFIHDETSKAVKIGKANDPQKRLSMLQVGCSNKLAMLAMIPGNQSEEIKFHRQFGHLKIRGEWFRAAPELLEFVQTIEAKKLGPFLELAELQPKLMALYEEAKKHREMKGGVFCANAVWYGYPGHRGIKPRLIELVGWNQRWHERLGTCEAYDIAYKTIYEALPDCRGECECSVIFNALATL